MHLVVTILVRIIEAMFVIGMIGTSVVILETLVEDIGAVFEKDENVAHLPNA